MNIQKFPFILITLLVGIAVADVVSVILLFNDNVFSAVVLHSIVSVLAVTLLLRKKAIKKSTLLFYGFLLFFTFVLPVIGIIGAFVFAHHHVFVNEKEKHEVEVDALLESSEVNVLELPLDNEKNYRDLLRHEDPESFLQLILSTKYMDEANAIRILKFALNTNIENVRLLAQARLDNKENEINQTIEKYIELSQSKKHRKNPRLHLEIAHQYWKLADLGLAKDAVLEHVLMQLQKYTHIVEKIMPAEPISYYLSAKAHLLNQNYQEAKQQFSRALKAGMPKNKVQIGLNEIAFYEKGLLTAQSVSEEKIPSIGMSL